MVAAANWNWPVFDVVGLPTTPGATWVWARDHLDHESVERARNELSGLFDEEPGPRRLLVYLGCDCFVDLGGLRLRLDLAAQLHCRGGALVVVAPPVCLTEMLAVLDLQDALPMMSSVRRAAWWARTSTRG